MKKGTKKNTARKERTKSSLPLPRISITDGEKELLTSIYESKKFIINNYSDMKNIPRSTTRSRLLKLDRIGLIYYKPKKQLGYVKILETGKTFIENIKNQGDEGSRLGGREIAKKNELSVHWHKFLFSIENRDKFRKEKLNFLNCSYIENKGMQNWNELIVYFDDATITIKPKTTVIELKDLVEDNAEEIDSKSLRRLIEYTMILSDIGLELGKLSTERGHWARVDSLLAEILYEKLGSGYQIIEDGKKLFWTDFSPNKLGIRHKEDEVPDKVARINLDHNISQQLKSQYSFDKINFNSMSISEIKETLGIVTQDLTKITEIKKIELQDTIEKNKQRNKELENNFKIINKSNPFIPSYIN